MVLPRHEPLTREQLATMAEGCFAKMKEGLAPGAYCIAVVHEDGCPMTNGGDKCRCACEMEVFPDSLEVRKMIMAADLRHAAKGGRDARP